MAWICWVPELVRVASRVSARAPLLAAMNLWVVCSPEVPEEQRPSAAYRAFHVAGVVFLTTMAILYLVARFVL